ncbi:hypothetical protein KSS87_001672 [Heliosperma pusillum]|nr:hypothetical protein KSS87_001672 [Heliosperma pusillum]
MTGKTARRKGKFASRFCLFAKVKSADSTSGYTPVYLNVYDLTPVNGYMYWAGLGIFHTGVEVHGSEYAFGAHDYPTSGVFEVEPRQCPGFKFRKAIFMGMTTLDPSEVREFMKQQSRNYYGSVCNCILPDSLKVTTIPEPELEVFESQVYECETKHLRPFNCFSSLSMSRKEDEISSLFLHTHYSGCLPPWQLTRTRPEILEDRD